ncbi:hypothetical protein [Aestuariivirga sp.]|uniref:hypothetical protein n=1 Tax=Aestuariivirga sp. TaxID=2650926 RepID=UPI003BABD91D
MRLFHKIFTIACLSSAALLPALAHADDVPPAVLAFLANIERQTHAKPHYDALTSDGSGNVTLKNLTLTKAGTGDDPGVTVKTAEVGFSGITEEAPSLFKVAKANFTNTSVEVSGKDVALSASIPNASAEGWYIRSVSATPTPKEELLSSGTFAQHIASGPVSITSAGQTVTIDNVESNWNGDPATGAGKFSLKINNVALPESTVTLLDQGGMLKQLGYTTLNLDLASDTDLTVNGDNLNYGFTVSLSGRNIGGLKFAGTVNDVPVSAYAEMMRAQSEGKPIDFDKLAPEFQNVVVNSASVRFDDASITKKILPLAAAMQGLDEKTLVASIPPTVQLTLIQLQNEALTKQAVDAVTRFLADPKSLAISANPPTPLKVSEFGMLDPSKPGDAVAKMGLSVTANE